MKTFLSISLLVAAASFVQAQCWNPFVPVAASVAYPMTTTYLNGNSATTINFGGRIAPVVPYAAPVVPTFTPVVAPRFQSALCFD